MRTSGGTIDGRGGRIECRGRTSGSVCGWGNNRREEDWQSQSVVVGLMVVTSERRDTEERRNEDASWRKRPLHWRSDGGGRPRVWARERRARQTRNRIVVVYTVAV